MRVFKIIQTDTFFQRYFLLTGIKSVAGGERHETIAAGTY